jgi:hypothetical protein
MFATIAIRRVFIATLISASPMAAGFGRANLVS